MAKRLILLVLYIGFFCSAHSQAKYLFTHLTTEEGIADNTINDILQDHKGFMWFATNNGLQRYDGSKFRNYHFDFINKSSLPSDIVLKLLEDDKGNIWIACNTGVAMIDQVKQKADRINIETDGREIQMQVSQLFQDSRKNIWLVSPTNGIFLFDSKAQRFISGNKLTHGLNWQTNVMVEEQATGNFWLGCDSGIAYFNVKARTMYNYKNNPLHLPLLNEAKLFPLTVTALFIDPAKNLWMNTVLIDYERSTNIYYTGYCYQPQTNSLTTYQAPANTMYSYVADREKNIWILGEKLLAVKQGNKFMPADYLDQNTTGKEKDLLRCFYEDRQHNRWIGTDNGVYAYSPGEAKIKRGLAFSPLQQPLEATVKSVLELPDKKIWIATTGNGILEYSFDFKPLKQYNYLGASDVFYANVWCLYKASNGKIWIGCEGGRVMIYDPVSQTFEKLTSKEFGSRTIRTITEDRQSNIWFGTQYGVLVKYDAVQKKFLRYADFSKEALGNINHLMVDKKNNLWACTAGLGLLKINVVNGKITEQYLHNNNDLSSISGNLVRRILEYSDSLMIVSSTGINIFNTKTKKFSYITTANGLPSNNVAGLSRDALGSIWAGLNGALIKVSMPSRKIEVFGKTDGIINTGFQQDAMQVLSDGRLVAGTNKDFIYFNPQQFRSNEPPPNVKITSFRVFQQELNVDSILMQDDKVRLSANQNFITIDFSALTYLNNKLYFYYKLEGVDKDWVKTTALSAVYPYLDGGNYKFMVRSENGEGVASQPTTLKIYIRPPFYETWWFFVLLAGLTAWIFYFFHRVRVNRLIDMQKVRGRIARDLHDDMGSTLSTINILSEMAKFKIEKDINVTKDYISKISDNSHRMMEAMDDIVWSINPLNDNMQKITARMREYATSLLEAKDIEYTFHVDEAIKNIKLDMEARRDFFLIFKEAVNNLVKYSQCHHAHIKIETYEYTMIMKIQDDGVGFVVADADSGNGLSNMQKRAQTLNAKLAITSKPGVGTKIILEVIFA